MCKPTPPVWQRQQLSSTQRYRMAQVIAAVLNKSSALLQGDC